MLDDEPTLIDDAKEMLKRWSGYQCQCDETVGFLCEMCHDIGIVKRLVAFTSKPATPATSAQQ